MFWAPVVAWEISDPPTTPRGTSRSLPGLTTFIAPSLTPLGPGDLDLQRRLWRCLVVDLECRMGDPEALLEHALKLPAAFVTVVPGAHHHMGREGRKTRGDLPDVQVVDLHDSGLFGQRLTDLLRLEARG